MVDGMLAALVKHQAPDGSFFDANSRDVRQGTTALATLALLADGNTERRGRYSKEVTRALRFLMSTSVKEGPRKGYLTAPGDGSSRMHGHGLALLALTQAHGMFGARRRYAGSAKELGEAISAGVDLILRSQSLAGGWFYEPLDRVDDEASMTVVMIQALRGARNCGFHVPKKKIAEALEYVRRSQNTDGSVRYRLSAGDDQNSFELTAAACATLAHGGAYRDVAVRRARDFLWSGSFDDFLGHGAVFPYYGMFYAVQTLWFDYDYDRMSRNYPRIVAWFEERWDAESENIGAGSRVLDKESRYGVVYRLAFASLTLQIPYQQLPIFAR